jgi:hypothetical protein
MCIRDRLLPFEKEDLKAFLKTLTDTVFINDPRYSRPDDLPAGVSGY